MLTRNGRLAPLWPDPDFEPLGRSSIDNDARVDSEAWAVSRECRKDDEDGVANRGSWVRGGPVEHQAADHAAMMGRPVNGADNSEA